MSLLAIKNISLWILTICEDKIFLNSCGGNNMKFLKKAPAIRLVSRDPREQTLLIQHFKTR